MPTCIHWVDLDMRCTRCENGSRQMVDDHIHGIVATDGKIEYEDGRVVIEHCRCGMIRAAFRQTPGYSTHDHVGDWIKL